MLPYSVMWTEVCHLFCREREIILADHYAKYRALKSRWKKMLFNGTYRETFQQRTAPFKNPDSAM